MTLTRAMSVAQDLHPARMLPKQNAWENEQDVVEAFQILNRIRASLTNDSWPHKVHAFHRLYKVPVGTQGKLQQISSIRRVLRRRLVTEEVRETFDADLQSDLIETVDGLLDTIYVCLGWMLELGLTPDEINLCMEEVHASNMTKVDASGKPVYDDGGKVLKGDNYVPPNLRHVLDLLPREEPSNG